MSVNTVKVRIARDLDLILFQNLKVQFESQIGQGKRKINGD